MSQPANRATTRSFEKSANPLSLTLRPSRLYCIALITLHLLAAAATLTALLPTWLYAILLTAVALSLYYNLHQQQTQPQLIWRTGDRWLIQHRDQVEDATLHGIDFYSRWLVILSLRKPDKRRLRTVISFDALDENTFRLLRVRLKIEGFALLNPYESN